MIVEESDKIGVKNNILSNNAFILNKKEIIKDIFYKSLIGKDIEVIDSINKNYIGIKGKIVNETKNLFIIRTKESYKKLLKKTIIFKMVYNSYNSEYKNQKYSKTLKINGEFLNTDLISRIKKIKKF